MIEVKVLKARHFIVENNGTFLEYVSYFGRWSKTGNCYVIRCEEGHWIPFDRLSWAYNRSKVHDHFESVGTIYMRNRKRLNEFQTVEEYFNGKNCKRQWYTAYNDKYLYSKERC